MMGLYNVMFGENQFGPVLVELVNKRQPIEVGRYRDAWVEAHGDRPLIRVHTRNGGGNREDYDDPSMQAHPWYVRDEDDDFDCTYADYWFAPDPDDLDQETMAALVTMAGDPVNMGERWRQAIDAIGHADGRE
jgi:hypothetical protein